MTGVRSGFTILELLTAMTIIAILAGLSIAGYTLARQQTKIKRAKSEIETWYMVLNEYRVEKGRYPNQWPSAGISKTASKLSHYTGGSVSLVDPWGREYQYVCSNRFQCHIWSSGQDINSVVDDIHSSLSKLL